MESSTPCAVHATAHRHSESSEAEIGQIFSQFGQSFRQTHNLSSKQSRVLSALSLCRTGFLGIHKQSCNDCDHSEYLHNSWLGAPAGSPLSEVSVQSQRILARPPDGRTLTHGLLSCGFHSS